MKIILPIILMCSMAGAQGIGGKAGVGGNGGGGGGYVAANITPQFVFASGVASTSGNSTGTTVNQCATGSACPPHQPSLADNLLLFFVTYADVSTTITPTNLTCNSSGCTNSGDTCAMIGSPTAAQNGTRLIAGYCKKVTAGTNYLSLAFSTNTSGIQTKIVELSKIDTTTPIDTSITGTSAGSTTVQASSITPGAANKFLVMAGARTQTPKSGSCGVGVAHCFDPGTGQTGITWDGYLSDPIWGMFVQGGLYTSGSAINPQFTMADSSGYAAIAVTLNPASAGNDRGTGIQIISISHHHEASGGATIKLQIPAKGNFIALSSVNGGVSGSYQISGAPTDNDSCTWVQAPAGAIGTSGDGRSDLWYCANSTPNVTKLINVPMSGTTFDYDFYVYDMSGVATSSPISADYKSTTNVSLGGAVSSFTLFPPLVPANTDGFAIMNCGLNSNTFQLFVTPTAATATVPLFGGEDISGGSTHPPGEENCSGYMRTTDGTTAQVWNIGWPTALANDLVYRVTYIKSATATVNGTTAPITVDNFTRADNLLTTGVGAFTWAAENGKITAKIVSNVAVPNSLSSDGGTIDIRQTFSNDQWAQGTFGTLTGGTSSGGQGLGVFLRAATGARTEYRCVVNAASTNNIQCGKYVTGTFTALKTCSANSTPAGGDVFYAQVSGTSFSFKQNGSAISACAFTDSSIASGSPGIGYSSTMTAASFSEFRDGNI